MQGWPQKAQKSQSPSPPLVLLVPFVANPAAMWSVAPAAGYWLESVEGRDSFRVMTTALAAELTKLNKRQKLNLANQLLAEAGAHKKPNLIRSSDDPALEAELRRRLADRSPGAWLSLDEVRAKIHPGHAPVPRPSSRRS